MHLNVTEQRDPKSPDLSRESGDLTWPEHVRHAVDFDRNDPTADAVRRGIPVGPPAGHDGSLPYPPVGRLFLHTGTFDDDRRGVEFGDPLYPLAVFAYQRRNQPGLSAQFLWGLMSAWTPGRKRGNSETIAFIVASGMNLGLSDEQVRASFPNAGTKTLGNKGTWVRAKRHRIELRTPGTASVPRVISEGEQEVRKRLLEARAAPGPAELADLADAAVAGEAATMWNAAKREWDQSWRSRDEEAGYEQAVWDKAKENVTVQREDGTVAPRLWGFQQTLPAVYQSRHAPLPASARDLLEHAQAEQRKMLGLTEPAR